MVPSLTALKTGNNCELFPNGHPIVVDKVQSFSSIVSLLSTLESYRTDLGQCKSQVKISHFQSFLGGIYTVYNV